MSGPANEIWILARRTPFLVVAWFISRHLFLATGLGYLTYSLFDWFDHEADSKKKLAVSKWLKGEPYTRLDIMALIIGRFDWLYGSTLLTIRGFFRASLVTVIAWALYLGYDAAVNIVYGVGVFFSVFPIWFPGGFVIWIFCDYFSLIVIRRYLEKALVSPILALIRAFLIGICFIFVGFVVMNFYFAYRILKLYSLSLSLSLIYKVPAIAVLAILTGRSAEFGAYAPTLLLYTWLILFAIGALFSQLIYWGFKSVTGMQGIIKQGDRHPIRAIGFVAMVIIFCATLTLSYL
jgi:hypothetical protein